MIADPLILTLKLDPHSFGLFESLRRAHFPPERNLIPAHLTLFHHLPGPQVAAIQADLKRTVRDMPALPLQVTGLKSLGRGVAFTLRSAALEDLRRHLADLWADWLIPQDRQGFRPHVTVQNKADPRVARETLAGLSRGFVPFAATGQGLLLWRYRGGPWEPLGGFPFAAGRF